MNECTIRAIEKANIKKQYYRAKCKNIGVYRIQRLGKTAAFGIDSYPYQQVSPKHFGF